MVALDAETALGRNGALARWSDLAGLASSAPETTMEPLAFAGHRGWLHAPVLGRGIRAAVVLCPPVGREARAAHRSLWLFAERLAAKDVLALRFDPLGQGESLDLPPDADAWSAWLDGVRRAAEVARAEAPGAPLVLAGLRLGASLAALAAHTEAPDGLMLLAPVIKGVGWLRELELQAAMLGGPRRHPEDGGLEADSLLFSASTLAGLTQLDLGRLRSAPPEAFLAHPGRPSGLCARLEKLGARVAVQDFPGYAELFREPYINSPPLEVLDGAMAWLERVAPTAGASRRPRALPAPLAPPGGQERPVSFGPGLRGMLCLPDRPGPHRRAVLLPNTGGDPRSGVGGFAVQASRALNRGGVAALRFDFAGLGDSAFAPAWRSDVYTTARGADFAAAIELLQAQGWTEIIAAGVCSGAYHALHAAMQDERIAAVFAVNPGDWIWPGKTVTASPSRDDLVSSRMLVKDIAKQALSPAAWRRMLAGDPRCLVLAQVLCRRVGEFWVHGPHREETRRLRAGMEGISRRGGRIHVIVGRADAALDEMEVRFGFYGAWLRRLPGASVRVVSGIDHGLACADSREVILNELLGFAGAEG